MPVMPILAQAAAVDVQQLVATKQCYLAFASLFEPVSSAVRQRGRGSLLLLTSPDSVTAGTAAAARIAGGGTLVVTADASAAKQSVRAGACDFLVSSLDEALRILKNEVRLAKPVGVCLLGSPHTVLAECIERGIQPDLLDCAEATLEQRGAHRVTWQLRLQDELEWVGFRANPPAQSQLAQAVECAASLLLEQRVPQQQERLHWLQNASAVLGRPLQRMRCVPMFAGERQSFLQRLAEDGLTQVELVSEL